MATDILEIFGTEYTGVTGIKATDSNNQTKIYIRPQDTLPITSNGNYDVTNYATASVSVSGSSVSLQSTTVTPTQSQIKVTAGSGYDGLSTVTVNAISNTYVGSGITTRSSSNLTSSGATVTAPAGYYAAAATKAVSSGSAQTPATTLTRNPTISVNASGLITASVSTSTSTSVTPTVTAGYITSGTAGSVRVTGSNTSQMSTVAATTYHPSTSDQTIAASRYTTGIQTFKAVTLSNLTASNIASGVTVKVGDSTDDDCVTSVTGSLAFITYYTGTTTPASSLGANNDIYLKVVS